MKRLIWIAAKERARLYDELWSNADILPRFYDIEQVPSLTSFIARSKTIAEQNFFIVDLSDAAYPDDQIMEAVRMLRQLSAARPIFIAPDCEAITILYGRLANEGVRDVIKENPGTDLWREMQDCISDEGKGFASRVSALQSGMAAQAKAQVQPLDIPEDLRLTCTVAGTMPRIGTTTQAVMMCRYLSSLGFRPLLVDDTHKLCDTLQLAYSDRVILHSSFLELDRLCCSANTCEDGGVNVRVI